MPHIHEEVRVEAPVEHVWDFLLRHVAVGELDAPG